MKRIGITLVLLLNVVFVPSAMAETAKFACGPSGQTYTVTMPAAVASEGTTCVGVLTLDTSVKSVADKAFYRAPITSLIISNSVTAIGDLHFCYKVNLNRDWYFSNDYWGRCFLRHKTQYR